MQKITKNLEFCGIYMLINTKNGKRYIGSSLNIRHRLWEHRANLRHNKHHNPHLQASWNKYGEDSFMYSILEACNIDTRFEREQMYVSSLNPEYNICTEVVYNPPTSEETRRKHSKTRKRLIQEGKIQITNNKPVYVYYKDGSFVGKWESIRQAAKAVNIHYSSACRVIQGLDYQNGGYKFFLEEQSDMQPFDKPNNSLKLSKTYIVDDGTTKKEFQGTKAVAEYLNTTKNCIQSYVRTHKKYRKKYMIYLKSAV